MRKKIISVFRRLLALIASTLTFNSYSSADTSEYVESKCSQIFTEALTDNNERVADIYLDIIELSEEFDIAESDEEKNRIIDEINVLIRQLQKLGIPDSIILGASGLECLECQGDNEN